MKHARMSSKALTPYEKYKLMELISEDANPFSGRELMMSHSHWYPDNVSRAISEYKGIPIPDYCERMSLLIEFTLFPNPKSKYKKVNSVRSSNPNYKRLYIISMMTYVYGIPLEKTGDLIGISTSRVYQILRKGQRIMHKTLFENMELLTSPISECYNMYAIQYQDRFIKMKEYADILSNLKLS